MVIVKYTVQKKAWKKQTNEQKNKKISVEDYNSFLHK